MNKQRVIQFINNEATNDNFLTIDDNRKITAFDENVMPLFEYGKREINDNDFGEVFQVLKQYIRNNPGQFELDELVHENSNWDSGTKDQYGDWIDNNYPNVTPIDLAVLSRSWWSPIVTINGRRSVVSGKARVRLPDGRLVDVLLTNSRKIQHHESGNFLHPNAFTEEQYEELKNLVPNTCRVKGCHNNLIFGPGYLGAGEGHRVVGGICNFHRVYPDYHYDIMEEFGLGNNNHQTPPQNNTNQTNNDEDNYNQEVANYNKDTLDLIFKLQDENSDIILQGDEKRGLLISLGKEGEEGVQEQIDIINENKEVDWFEPKEEGQVNHNDNQQIEARNKANIDDYKNWLARKKEAVKKLEAIFNQFNQEEPTNETPEPNQQSPNEEKNKNPIVENNKESNQNIEELSNLSLAESKSKAKEEIETLLDRYGVKISELDAKLWGETESWEKYLENLNDSEGIQKFVKKIKIAIIQKNNKDNQEIINSPLEEAKQKSRNQIEELLSKHNIEPSTLDKNLWDNKTNWQEYLETLTDNKDILDFVHKMRESIIRQSILEKANNRNTVEIQSDNSSPWLIVIPIFLLIICGGIGAAIIIRRRKRRKLNK